MTIERRIAKLEDYAQSRDPDKQKVKLIIYQLSGGCEPTEEEIEAAEKKFLEEHPGHKGYIVLNFLHLRDDLGGGGDYIDKSSNILNQLNEEEVAN